jgi:hypothetical protein
MMLGVRRSERKLEGKPVSDRLHDDDIRWPGPLLGSRSGWLQLLEKNMHMAASWGRKKLEL